MNKFDLYDVLNNGLEVDEHLKTIKVIPQLKPSDYTKVKNIINRLGGEWVKSDQYFQLKKNPAGLLDRVLSVGSRCLNKFHFYPTPPSIFKDMTQFTPLSYFGASMDSIEVLEPSCGEGFFMDYLAEYGNAEGRKFNVTGYDIDPLNVIFCQEKGYAVTKADFLTVKPEPKYDLVLMNPPFNGSEFIKHIQHAQKFLKPTGLLISVIPATWISNPEKMSESQSWLYEQAFVSGDSMLNQYDFFPAGTFEGVSIETTFVTLLAPEAAAKRLHSMAFKQECLDTFQRYMASDSDSYEALNKLASKENMAVNDIRARVERIVSKLIEQAAKEDSTILPLRFKCDYVESVISTNFPYASKTTNTASGVFAASSAKPISNNSQMGLLDDIQAA